MCIALKYKAQTSRQSPHLIRLFFKYWYILNKIAFRNLPEKKSMLFKKLKKHCFEPFFTCSGGHDTVWSHELWLGSQNYGSAPIITPLAPTPSLGLPDEHLDSHPDRAMEFIAQSFSLIFVVVVDFQLHMYFWTMYNVHVTVKKLIWKGTMNIGLSSPRPPHFWIVLTLIIDAELNL